MCSATRGASPVSSWTLAASEIFSYGSRGTPGWVNTLNRVPELPNAHDGSSISCSSSRARTCAPSSAISAAFLVGVPALMCVRGAPRSLAWREPEPRPVAGQHPQQLVDHEVDEP